VGYFFGRGGKGRLDSGDLGGVDGLFSGEAKGGALFAFSF
jgi:hypothetical protein